jgi:hypothetical protein
MLPLEEQYDVKAGWWDRLWGDPERIPTGEMVRFRKYDDFIDACENAVKDPSHAGLAKKVTTWKDDKSKKRYRKRVEKHASALARYMGQALAVQPGVTVVGFNGLHNLGPVTSGKTVAQDSDRWRITIMLFAAGADVLAHELGHCLFLPHAPSAPGTHIEGVTPTRHVDGDGRCLMAYTQRHPGYCAICLLRLRGADGEHLGPKGLVP